MTYSDQRTPASGLYKSLQILALDNIYDKTNLNYNRSLVPS